MKKLLFMPALAAIIALTPSGAKAQTITTIAGCGIGDDSLATKAELIGPVGVCMDLAGNTYIAESSTYRLRKVSPSGVITTFAGNGIYGSSGDGGQATAASIGVIYGVAADKHGNIFFVDNSNNCIRKVNPSGIISTIAGTGATGFGGDGGPAVAATLNSPVEIVIDTNDNIIFTDWLNNRVRKINTSGIITTIVGNGSLGTTGNGGPATAAQLGRPFRVTLDNKGNLYVAEVVFQCICKVDTGGILTIIADTTGAYATGTCGDGGPALSCTMTSPCGLAVDTSGHLYFSDIGNQRIRRIDLNTGIVSNYAATGTAGYGGDGGPAVNGMISTPEGLFCDPAGNVLICDADNNRVRKVMYSTAAITTFAGQNGLFGEGYPATNAELTMPINIATDAAGNIYIPDYSNNRIRKIDGATGIITTVAGSGIAGYDNGFSGDGGPATAANIYGPTGVAVDNAGNIYIADNQNQRIRKVNTAGIITTIAGNGNFGMSGDNGPATNAMLNTPFGVAVDAAGNVYIADEGNSRIRKVNTSGIITTVAGTGTAGYSGDGTPATIGKLRYPTDVTVDTAGNMYICDAYNHRIRKVDNAGIITTVAGSGVQGFAGDNGPAISALLNYPAGIDVDNWGNMFIADGSNQRIRFVSASGVITTIAGNGTAGFSGDGGPAVAAKLNTPTGVAIDQLGNMFISDGRNYRVRKVNLTLAVPVLGRGGLSDIYVFPNPATDQVTIANAANCNVTVSDMAGRQMLHTAITSVKQPVSVTGLIPGMYMVQVVNEKGESRTFRISKQ